LYLPIKLVAILIYNGLLGGVMLWLLNLVGGYVGFHIPINVITAPLAGFLGLPGILLLIILQYFWL
jgi:inhibitor of the pro-sigma K processing machinery